MESDWVKKSIDNATSLLSKWGTGRVKVWDYTPTHFKVTLRVESKDIPGNLHIVCGGCVHMRGPFSWNNCNFLVKQRQAEGGGMILSDTGADFELHCRVVAVEENVEPIYAHPNLGVSMAKEGKEMHGPHVS